MQKVPEVNEPDFAAVAAEILVDRPEPSGDLDVPTLAGRLEALVHGAFAKYPELGVEPLELARHLAGKLAVASALEVALDELVAEDLLLALACSRGEPRALETFEQAYSRELSVALAKLRVASDRHDDLRQRLWQKLFVGDVAGPRILEFSGRGPLQHWYRVTVVRALLDELRKDKRTPTMAADDTVLGVPASGPDPEMDHMKRLYRHEFQLAFEEAVVALSPDDRNMLRCHFAQQMTIDQIGVAFGIHRATAARRVNRARDHLISGTRERLAARLSLSEPEMQSVLRMIESSLHVSVARLLA